MISPVLTLVYLSYKSLSLSWVLATTLQTGTSTPTHPTGRTSVSLLQRKLKHSYSWIRACHKTLPLCFCEAKLFSMYSFSRLLSLSFNAKSYIIWLKILFWYFPADILHLLHSRLVSSSLATRLCHSIWIFDVFCKSNFPFLKRTAWVSPGNFLLLICIKTGFGQLASSASRGLPKKPASSK